MKIRIILLFWTFFSINAAVAQVTFTADSIVIPYEGRFGYGANVGAYPPWRDENLANLAAGNDSLGLDGIGINTFRPELPELFVEFWGYDIRQEAFEHYDKLGMKDHVLFLGTPSPEHRDSTFYCSDKMGKLFKNMYEPIWDDGQNGTPINEENYYANYVWKVAQIYGDYIKFWEVLNEPDLDTGFKAPLPPGAPGNWWENDPDPCDVNIFAPVEHYVRLLRITYEVVKSIDPNDYVAVGGFGNPSYLDAVLRNSDNPDDGSINAEYPNLGGAYFDCMSFHSYPHLDGSMRGWDNVEMDFVFFRHSDRALDGLLERRELFEEVLFDRGYNDIDKPQKEWILTESNIPRKAFQRGFVGTPRAQRNFLTKALVTIQQYDIRQFHVYSLADVEPVDSADFEFEIMGLVKNLNGIIPHAFELTEAGIAYGSCSKILSDYRFNDSLTQAMNLHPSDSIRGCGFQNEEGEAIFVLWAKTYYDSTEYAVQNFSFSDSLNLENLERFSWHYMATDTSDIISPVDIPLTGDPIFLKANFKKIPPKIDTLDTPLINVVFYDNADTTTSVSVPVLPENPNIKIFPNPIRDGFNVSFYLKKAEKLNIALFDSKGQPVREIFVDENRQPGEVFFFTKRGNLPPGVYFLKIDGQKFSATKRVVLF